MGIKQPGHGIGHPPSSSTDYGDQSYNSASSLYLFGIGSEFYSKVHTGTHFSDVPYSTWSETGHALSPQLLNFAVEYSIKTVQ
jgi:hypothetical protein